MASQFNQGAPTVPVVLSTSNCFVFGNTASGNALSVQQLGTGNVASFRTATGATSLFIDQSGNAGFGLTTPIRLIHGYAAAGSNEFRLQSSAVTIGMGINAGNNFGFVYNRTSNPLVFGTNDTERVRITETGNVGIGTSSPGQTLTVTNGGTVNFGNAMYTQYNTVSGASAATITAGFNTGTGPTPNTPTAGEYQWTIGGSTTYGNMVSLGLYPPGATFTWTFTARSTSTPVFFNFQTVANSVYVFSSPTLTSSYQTFTWTATIPSNGDRTCYFGVNGTASGQNIIWNSFTATRLDTIVTGNMGLGTTAPADLLEVKSNVTIANDATVPTFINMRQGLSGTYNCSVSTYSHNGDAYYDGLSLNGYDGVSICTGANTRQERVRIDSSGKVGIGTTPGSLLQIGPGGQSFNTAQNTGTKTLYDAGVNIFNGISYYSGFLQVYVNYNGYERTASLLYHYCACKNVTGGNIVVNATLLNSAVTASADFNAACTFTAASGTTFNILLQTSGTRSGAASLTYSATISGVSG